MLRAVIIGSNEDLVQRVSTLLGDAGAFVLMQSISGYPDDASIERVLRIHAPQVVFLDVDVLDEALRVCLGFGQLDPHLPVVAFHEREDPQVFRSLMRAGVRDLLTADTSRSSLLELADVIRGALENNPLRPPATGRMVSFFPAKPGVGASTIAVNLSIAASQRSNEQAPVLLADLDFDTGLIGFLLNLSNPCSVMDLMERLPQLDEDLWFQLLSRNGNLHVLASGRESRGMRPQVDQIEAVVDFVRKLYRIVCIDLPGNLDACSLGLLKQSDQIVLVSTAEIPALRLATERHEMLSSLGLGDRVSVLLNRWDGKSPISLSEAEKMLGTPVLATLPNDYQSVHRALTAGRPVNSGSGLARRFAELADRILPTEEPEAQTTSKRARRGARRLVDSLFR